MLKVTSTWIEEFFLPHPLHLDGILPETQHQIFPLVPWELQKLNPSAGTTLAIPSPELLQRKEEEIETGLDYETLKGAGAVSKEGCGCCYHCTQR